MTHKEIAQHLNLSVRTVEGQILKGMHLLGDALFGAAGDPSAPAKSTADDAVTQRAAHPADGESRT
jgi:hypothetical protein